MPILFPGADVIVPPSGYDRQAFLRCFLRNPWTRSGGKSLWLFFPGQICGYRFRGSYYGKVFLLTILHLFCTQTQPNYPFDKCQWGDMAGRTCAWLRCTCLWHIMQALTECFFVEGTSIENDNLWTPLKSIFCRRSTPYARKK